MIRILVIAAIWMIIWPNSQSIAAPIVPKSPEPSMLRHVEMTQSSLDELLQGLSLMLEPGMTEDNVVIALGYRPTKVEMKTCGPDKGRWTCKIYVFGNSLGFLKILFGRVNFDSKWHVNSWIVFP